MGLKPIIKQVCPVEGCDYKFRYHVRDPRMHPDLWVMTSESREHLATPHAPKQAPVIYIVKTEAEPKAA